MTNTTSRVSRRGFYAAYPEVRAERLARREDFALSMRVDSLESELAELREIVAELRYRLPA